jgi:hypothetical protein
VHTALPLAPAEQAALAAQPPLLTEHTCWQLVPFLTKPVLHVQLTAPPAPSEHVALPPQPPLFTVHWFTQGSEPFTLV